MSRKKMLVLAAVIAGALAAPAAAQTYTNTWSFTAVSGTSPGSIIQGTISGFSNGTNLSGDGLTFTVTQSPYADLLGSYTTDANTGTSTTNQYTASNGVVTAISTKYTNTAGSKLYLGLNDSIGYYPQLLNSSGTENLYNSSKTALVFAAATPEPATWSLMILGFGITGAALRRQRRTTVRGSFATRAA